MAGDGRRPPPRRATFRSASATSGQCSSSSAGTRGATVICHLGTLKSGDAGRIHIKVTVRANNGTIRDTATVTSVTPDPRGTGNTATAATKIIK